MLTSTEIKTVLLSVLLLLTNMILELIILGLIYLVAGNATDASEIYTASEILSDLKIDDIGYILVSLIVA